MAKAKDSLDPHDSFCFWKMASAAASTERADGRNDLATTVHGHTGTACADCTNTRICDCGCNVCVLARRRSAGHICLECDEICGSTKCADCATPPCRYCGDRGCDGGMYCDAADYDESEIPCYDCNRVGCNGGLWCPANERDDCSTDSEMEEMMREEREEEDRRFRAQIARRSAAAAAKPATAGWTITATITPKGSSVSYEYSAAGAAAGAGAGGGSSSK